MLNLRTGEVRSANCGSLSCTACAMRCVRRHAAVMTWPMSRVQRPRLVTLTKLPTVEEGDDAGQLDWQATRWQVRDLGRRLRQDYRCEWAWAVEPNPKGTGYHLHAIQHGDYLPQRELETLWGGRRVDIRAVKCSAAQYVSKEAARVTGYVSKGARSAVKAHQDVNGGRIYHSSRGYHMGLTRQQVRQEMAKGVEGQWVLVTADSVGMGT